MLKWKTFDKCYIQVVCVTSVTDVLAQWVGICHTGLVVCAELENVDVNIDLKKPQQGRCQQLLSTKGLMTWNMLVVFIGWSPFWKWHFQFLTKLFCWDQQKYDKNLSKVVIIHKKFNLLGKYFPARALLKQTSHKFIFSLVPCKTNIVGDVCLTPVGAGWKSYKDTGCLV